VGKVYDCTILFDELDMLELKLEVEYPIVNKFIIVESTKTHRGDPKPLHFNPDRFKKYLDKIDYRIALHLDDKNDIWNNVTIQRDLAMESLKNCDDDDIIIVSDIDEIINPKASFDITEPHCIEMNLYYYYLNCLCEKKWTQPVALPYRDVKKFNSLAIPRELKNCEYSSTGNIIKDGGWHFSFLGGVDKIIKKIESFYHSEYDNEYFKNPDRIVRMLNRGEDLFDREDMQFKLCNIDNSYPQYVIDNKEKYEKMEFIKSRKYIWNDERKELKLV
jgi:hypothetical protein